MSEGQDAETQGERIEEKGFPAPWPTALGDIQDWIAQTILAEDRRAQRITVWIGGQSLLDAKRQTRNIRHDFAEFRAALTAAHGMALKLDYDEAGIEHRARIVFPGAPR